MSAVVLTFRCELCGKQEGDGVHLLKCARCRNIRYCSVECQKEDWPRHKGTECNSRKAGRDILNGLTGGNTYTQLRKWLNKCVNPLAKLVHSRLMGRLRFHVLLLNIDHVPDSNPPFKIREALPIHVTHPLLTSNPNLLNQVGAMLLGIEEITPNIVDGNLVKSGLALAVVDNVVMPDLHTAAAQLKPVHMTERDINKLDPQPEQYIAEMNCTTL